MYWVLGGCALASLLLVVPRMDIYAPGEGLMATRPGTVTEVTDEVVVVGDVRYPLTPEPPREVVDGATLVLPQSRLWQEAAVEVGDTVQRKELVARGITHIFFQANIWIFTSLVFVIGILMGIGKAAVYKHIPVLGGLGGFFCPIIFGYLLRSTGIWTTCWIFFFILSVACLVWMHVVIRRMMASKAPHLAQQIDTWEPGARPDSQPYVGA